MTETTVETKAETTKVKETQQSSMSATKLKNFVERIERLEDQKNNFLEDIREVYKEAAANGFDISTMKKIVRLRKMDMKKLEEQEYLFDLYRSALGL